MRSSHVYRTAIPVGFTEKTPHTPDSTHHPAQLEEEEEKEEDVCISRGANGNNSGKLYFLPSELRQPEPVFPPSSKPILVLKVL